MDWESQTRPSPREYLIDRRHSNITVCLYFICQTFSATVLSEGFLDGWQRFETTAPAGQTQYFYGALH